MKTRNEAAPLNFFREDHRPVEWRVNQGLVAYEDALAHMERRAEEISAGKASEEIWLIEHPPLYTAGISSNPRDLVSNEFPVYETGRGGQYTYHGPGQRVAYAMLDLTKRRQDLRAYVASLEAWIIETLGEFSITGERREDRVGVWVKRPDKGVGYEDKIAAIGIRVRKWVSFHGISLNVVCDGPANGRCITLLGGITNDHRLWNTHVARLAASYRVIRIDGRGHGLSDSTPSPYALPQLAREPMQLATLQLAQLMRRVDRFQQFVHSSALGFAQHNKISQLPQA